jgi:leucyl aminopeptidase
MRASLFHDDPLSAEAPLLAFAVFQDEEISEEVAEADAVLGGAFSRARASGDFRGHEEEFALFYVPAAAADDGTGPARIVFVGAGPRSGADADTLRRFAARAVRRAESLYLTKLALHVPTGLLESVEEAVRASVEGAALAAWDFRELKTGAGPDEEEEEPKPLVEEAVLAVSGDPEACARALRLGSAVAAGEGFARDLQWRPGNLATPSHLAETALGLAESYGFASTILGPKELAEERMHALLAVSAGSEEEPRLIVLEHRGGDEGAPPVALVGKGLTFDAGGISIKPAQGMEEMKYDMSGGAAVLGAMRAIGELEIPINVVGVVPSSENLLSGRATKPGDVIRTRRGKTVEVINTDAEGRLILADALAYTVDRFKPAAVVDLATLTGACVIALGHHAAAVLGSDEALIAELRDAGDRATERCWPLPLWDPYRKQLESAVADLKNVGGRPAGTITAAWFLAEFVGEIPWAHLDIAGTAYGEPIAPYHRKGGFGSPTRLLVEWVLGRAG